MSRWNDSLSVPTEPRTTDAAVAASEQVLYQILRQGEYCCVLAPASLGKLLRVRVADRLRAPRSSPQPIGDEPGLGTGEAAPAPAGCAGSSVWVVVLDLAAVAPCESPEQWYERLLAQVGPQVGLAEELDRFWRMESPLSPLQRWMAALRQIALPALGVRSWELRVGERQPLPDPNSQLPTPNSSLVIFIDEIEAVRRLPFSTDEFFSAIRECYNRRTRDPELRRLTFCLTGAERLATLIRDPATTWFNVGRRLELTEEGAAGPAAAKRDPGSHWSPACALLKRARDWICGEPYCTQSERITGRCAAFMPMALCPR